MLLLCGRFGRWLADLFLFYRFRAHYLHLLQYGQDGGCASVVRYAVEQIEQYRWLERSRERLSVIIDDMLSIIVARASRSER
jgi:hypothetical protein